MRIGVLSNCCNMMQIGVIGAGAGGLCAARHILANRNMKPIVWEQSNQVGGTWVYNPDVGLDKNDLPIHSSMYKSLKTNLPKEVMAFPDFPFADCEKSFIHHTEVLKYLEDYTEYYKVAQHIKFGHHVESVSPVIFGEGESPSWKVTVTDLASKTTSTTTCEALIVCNGHYSVPRIPAIKGLDLFEGSVSHSHDYREPDSFEGKKVVILGAAASGLDISLEIAKVAKEVYLSHNLPLNIPSELPGNMKQVRGVREATKNGFMFGDITKITEADAIVLCTGYEFVFPFLEPSCGVYVENNQVKPLYKHLIHSTFPTMAFIGIPFQICPFPMFHYQVLFFLAVLQGYTPLPSTKEMRTHTEAEVNKKKLQGFPAKHYHLLGHSQWSLMNDYADQSKCSPLPSSYKQICDIIWDRRLFNIRKYKTYRYCVEGHRVREFFNGTELSTNLDIFIMKLRNIHRIPWRHLPQLIYYILSQLRIKAVAFIKP